jgi:hypothetical protein
MTDVNSAPNQARMILQAPTPSNEAIWIERLHGAEMFMTIVALIVGAGWAVFGDWRKNRAEREKDRTLFKREQNQRKRQLRWDQAKLAKEINDQFLADHEAQEALGIVDSDGSTIDIADTESKYTVDLERGEHVTALRINPTAANKKEVFVRDCFDAWFYWMSTMEQYLKNGVIRQEDIAFPSDYYLRQLMKEPAVSGMCQIHISLRFEPTHCCVHESVYRYCCRWSKSPTDRGDRDSVKTFGI